ncbi:hypothetical protein O3M35_007051 [Rhynocoris fuscipes]|uniref:Coiled-coil domain-containing protein 103 n=1 Tax=Rhynocoris fuscipes TaxID=488301 RepID=A0AAW1DFE3_9HEMI
MAEFVDIINFKSLEQELQTALEKDKLYWQQNDTKIRASQDHRLTYDEFRELVNGAHLKPLDKHDKMNSDKIKTIWNPVCAKKKNQDIDRKTEMDQQSSFTENEHSCCKTWTSVIRRLKEKESPQARYQWLKSIGNPELKKAFANGIPVGVLGEILEALATFPPETNDIVSVVRIMDALADSERFRLSLEFLSCAERDTIAYLLDKISKSLIDRQQDLAENNVTEWTVDLLRGKYSLTGNTRKELNTK